MILGYFCCHKWPVPYDCPGVPVCHVEHLPSGHPKCPTTYVSRYHRKVTHFFQASPLHGSPTLWTLTPLCNPTADYILYPDFLVITKGSVSYLSSPCFSTIIGGIGGPARGKRRLLDVNVLDINYKGPPPSKMVMGSIPTGDAVTVRHSRGTLSMREMSL